MRLTEIIPENQRREVLRQNEERKHWKTNDTLSVVLVRFMIEYAELIQAIEDTPEIAYLIASEIGDMFYLAIKYESLLSEGSELPQGIVVALEYALEICELTGLEPADCLMMKVFRNEVKYFAPIMNNGFKPDEAVEITKSSYKVLVGGEEKFSHWYEQFGEQLKHTN